MHDVRARRIASIYDEGLRHGGCQEPLDHLLRARLLLPRHAHLLEGIRPGGVQAAERELDEARDDAHHVRQQHLDRTRKRGVIPVANLHAGTSYLKPALLEPTGCFR
jgi:hypothetical protein